MAGGAHADVGDHAVTTTVFTSSSRSTRSRSVLVEAAETALGDLVVLRLGIQLVNDLGAPGALDAVGGALVKFLVVFVLADGCR